MGLFDFFRKADGPTLSKQAREIARLERLVSNKLSQNFDRQDALEQLGRIASADAAAVLLKRFNWHLDPSITDLEEKEVAVRGIVAAGEAALPPIREYCRRAEGLTWPLKALSQIVEADRYADELLTLLDQFDTEYVRNAEPKVQLLTALSAFARDDVRLAIEQFIEDASEPVRFAAVNAAFSMKNELSVEVLVAAMPREESLRIKNRVAQGIVEAGWRVPLTLVDVCRGHLPPGFRLSPDGTIQSLG